MGPGKKKPLKRRQGKQESVKTREIPKRIATKLQERGSTILNTVSVFLAALGLVAAMVLVVLQISDAEPAAKHLTVFCVYHVCILFALLLCSGVLLWRVARKSTEVRDSQTELDRVEAELNKLEGYVTKVLEPHSAQMAERWHRLHHHLRDLVCDIETPFTYSDEDAGIALADMCDDLSLILKAYFGERHKHEFHVWLVALAEKTKVITVARSWNSKGILDDTVGLDLDGELMALNDWACFRAIFDSPGYFPFWADDDLGRMKDRLVKVIPGSRRADYDAAGIIAVQKPSEQEENKEYELAGFLLVSTNLEGRGQRIFTNGKGGADPTIRNLMASFADLVFLVVKKGRAGTSRKETRLGKGIYFVDPGNFGFVELLHRAFMRRFHPKYSAVVATELHSE